ncbi:MAG: hypothetical protein JNG88_09585, partial [Phycisphaerales bacterium]|nr:hypothetical protein [Phycisphaerales bacterium]
MARVRFAPLRFRADQPLEKLICMAILQPSDSAPPSVSCVREVRVEIWFENADRVRAFYTEILSMLPWPAARQIPGGWGAGDPKCGLYFQVRHDPPPADPMRRRFSLIADSLDTLEKRLIEREVPYQRVRG